MIRGYWLYNPSPLKLRRLANPRLNFGFVSRRAAGAPLRIAKPEGIKTLVLNAASQKF